MQILLQEVAVAPGFTPDHILIADIPLSPNSHGKPNERIDFYERVLQQTATLPGVRTAGASSLVPVSGTGSAMQIGGLPDDDVPLDGSCRGNRRRETSIEQ